MQVPYRLLRTGDDTFNAMLEGIATAKHSIRFEMYIYRDCSLGEKFLKALVEACRRGMAVQVLIDGWGSYTLNDSYWKPLLAAGGEFTLFNPLRLNRCLFRDHRKLVVIDEEMAFIGGCNVAPEYEGDGVSC